LHKPSAIDHIRDRAKRFSGPVLRIDRPYYEIDFCFFALVAFPRLRLDAQIRCMDQCAKYHRRGAPRKNPQAARVSNIGDWACDEKHECIGCQEGPNAAQNKAQMPPKIEKTTKPAMIIASCRLKPENISQARLNTLVRTNRVSIFMLRLARF
jgi:hypothetical protein